MESYILTRSMHLGYIKETFGRGSVLSFNPQTRSLTIDGRRFDDYRDLEILKRQAQKSPNAPWVIPFSEENLQNMLGGSLEPQPAVPRRAPNGEGMEIVQSDEDMHETIDISNTKVSTINQARKEAERQKVKDEGMPIIQGDESVEDRIARLKEAKDTDLAARAERVRLMSERKASMPVVHDDSLGSPGGSKSAALNAGMPVSGKRPEETPESIKAAAEARKAQAEANRQKVAAEMGFDPDQAGIDEATPTPAVSMENIPPAPTAEEMVAAVEASKNAEIAELKARLAALEAVAKTDKPIAKTPVVTQGE